MEPSVQKVAREFIAWQGAPFKVAAIDCDHTLWRGVVSEDGGKVSILRQNIKCFSAFKTKAKEGLCLS
ncbi:hypothetical protein ACEQPO_05170 [Bacillus sp. SL00103]